MTEFIIMIATISLMACWALVAIGSVADDRMRDIYEREMEKTDADR